MAIETISPTGEIKLPEDILLAIGLKPGDELIMVTRGDHIIMAPKPKDWEKSILGIGKGLYGENYLQEERDSWDRKE